MIENSEKNCSHPHGGCAPLKSHAKNVYEKTRTEVTNHIPMVLTGMIVLLILFCAAFCAPSSSTVAVLDVDKLRGESKAYQQIMEKQKYYEEIWQIRFTAEREVLDQEDKDLAARRKTMKAAQLKKAVDALQKKAINLQQKYQAEASKIVMATQIAAKDVDQIAIDTVREVAKHEGYGIVIPKTSTIYTSDKVDMTDTFVKELNKKTINVLYPDPATLTPPKNN